MKKIDKYNIDSVLFIKPKFSKFGFFFFNTKIISSTE